MNKIELLLLSRTGPLQPRVRSRTQIAKVYLCVCLVFGVITVLPLFHYMSRWDQPSETEQLFLNKVADLEEGLVYSGEVIKSALDPRTYTTLVLSNGLRVLVVSDPLTRVAAASCDVAVGSFSDPVHVSGLAHLLEHSVFLGDSQHPQPNTFERFLAQHSGHSNAYTSQENTNYYYKVAADKLGDSLERFSSLLSQPTLNFEVIRKEFHALDNEFWKDKLESARRIWRLIKHLANPVHPFHRFSPGNMDTLSNLEDATLIRQLHARHYHAENMRCVVYGREDPQDLLKLSRKSLGGIRSRDRAEREKDTSPAPAFPPSRLGRLIEHGLLREGNELDLIWPLVGSSRCGVGSAIQILSEKDTKSALAYLKTKGYASSLSWSTIISTSTFTLLRANVKLTELGRKHAWQVAEAIFTQIHLARGEPENAQYLRLLKIHQQALQSFVNQQFGDVHHQAKILSSRMSKVIHPVNYLGAPVSNPAISCLSWTLSSLTPRDGIILLGSSSRPKEPFTFTEPWYGIPFTVHNLTDRQLTDLRDSEVSTLALPPVPLRTRIPRTFPLHERDLGQGWWTGLVHDSEGLKVWWGQDTTFHTPRVDIVMWVYSAEEHSTARDTALHLLLVETLRDVLQDRQLPPGYTLTVRYQSSSGLLLTLSGYSDREEVARCLTHLVSVLTRLETGQVARFEHVIKYQAHRELARSDFAEAYKHPLFKSRVLLEPNVASLSDVMEQMTRISMSEFYGFYKSFSRGWGARCLVYGNVVKTTAEQYAGILSSLTRNTIYPALTPPAHLTLQYPPGTYYTTTTYPNSRETASVADLTIIVGPTPWQSDTVGSGDQLFKRSVLARLTAALLTEPAFIELRTNQQLGYSVFTKYVPHFGIDYIHMCVEGSEHSATHMASSILVFLEGYRGSVAGLADPSATNHWNALVAGVRQDLLLRPESQHALAGTLAAELFSPDPEPDRADMMVGALQRVVPEDLIAFYEEYVMGERSRRVLLLAQSQGRVWDLSSIEQKFELLDSVETRAVTPFLYWHFTYLGLEMGK